MAWVGRHGKNWRAQIRRVGHPPISKTFPTKARAWAWAAETERELLAGLRYGELPKRTLAEAFERYAKDESPKKRGERWEQLRLKRMARDPIAKLPLAALTEAHLADWRDRMLAEVSPGTVRRVMGLLGAVLEVSRREWRWLDRNPLKDVRKPAAPPARRRGVAQADIDAIVGELAGNPIGRHVEASFRFAVETAMRAGEIVGLEWRLVDLERRVATLPRTKNGDARVVPLSSAAVAILEAQLGADKDRPFPISTATLDALFRKARDAAGVVGVRFHDSRSEAITRLSRKLDVLELARMVGHRDPKSLMIYYAKPASETAEKLR